jgi:hypothetical protein
MGLLEQASKPQLFRHIAIDTARVNAGAAGPAGARGRPARPGLWTVAPGWQAGEAEDDDERPPLVRRQRLTLEQSLLLAILRREFLQREQEGGIGRPVQIAVDSLLPQLEIYRQHRQRHAERKRLAALLEHLRGHGVVSDVDAQERITIRPMIAHLANPENLQALLTQLRALSADSTGNAT